MVFSWKRERGDKMKEIQEPVNYIATKYISEDGKTFSSKSSCEKHEDEIKTNKIASSLPCFKVDDNDWYKISTKEEFYAWLTFMQNKNTYWRFDRAFDAYSFSQDWYRIDSYYESRYEDFLYCPQSLSDRIESLNWHVKEAQENLYNFQKEWNDTIK
jgi:roadblock/LC7 domain-containing protein